MRAHRVLISATGPRRNVLKIRPPLVFSHEHADQFLTVFSEVLAVVGAGGWEIHQKRES